MQRGDLSNKVVPRLVVVFDNALGMLPVESLEYFDKAMKRKRYWEAVAFWQLNFLMLDQIKRLNWQASVNIEVCTWQNDEEGGFAFALAERLDELNIPVRSVWASTPEDLAKALARLPDIQYVYDPDPAHVFTYGGKGVVLKQPNQIGRGN